jgi:cellulose synthase/poly-beta-1,6-N-acetylglucosamine synthase-like glycosyltransferase
VSPWAVAAWCAVAIAGIWFGYPLGLALVAAVRGRRGNGHASPTSASRRTPNVTVVIATREPASVVRARVADALAVEYPPESLEVVVAVDAQHPDLASELAGLPARARVVPGDAPGGKAAALNAGVRAATGDVLVFTDSYQRFGAHTIQRLADVAMVPENGAVSGNLALASASRGSPIALYWRYEVWVRTLEAAVSSVIGVFGPIWAMRRELWLPLPPGVILDDVYAPMRLVLSGRRVTIVPDAPATELRNPTPVQEYRRKVRTMTGVLQLCAWLPHLLVPWRNPVWVQFVFHKLLRLTTAYLVLGAVAALVVGLARTIEPRLVGMIVASMAVVGLIAAARPRLRRRLAEALASVVTIQAALIVAAYNGVRGRWNVWHR